MCLAGVYDNIAWRRRRWCGKVHYFVFKRGKSGENVMERAASNTTRIVSSSDIISGMTYLSLKLQDTFIFDK